MNTLDGKGPQGREFPAGCPLVQAERTPPSIHGQHPPGLTSHCSPICSNSSPLPLTGEVFLFITTRIFLPWQVSLAVRGLSLVAMSESPSVVAVRGRGTGYRRLGFSSCDARL